MRTVTILSTVRNIKDTAGPWLDSLVGQQYPGRFEIVIVDSESTDGTKEILEQYQAKHSNIKVYEFRSNQPEALNYALKNRLLTGDLIALIDGDCVAPADWLDRMAGTVENERVDAAGGPGLTPKDANLVQKIIGYELDTRFLSIKEGLVQRQPNMNMIVKRRVLEELLFDVTLPIGYDADFCYRLNESGYKLWFNPGAIVYHYHRSSVRKYLKQQYLNARYGMKFSLRSKNKVNVDNINPLTMLLQPVIFGVLLLCVPVLALSLEAGALALALSFVTLFGIFTIEILKSYHIKRNILVVTLYGLYTIRLPFWFIGIVSGAIAR